MKSFVRACAWLRVATAAIVVGSLAVSIAIAAPVDRITIAEQPYMLAPGAVSVAPGASLSVTWSAPAGSSAYDWVALYRVGDPNTSYLWWQHTGGTTSGTAALTAPFEPGSYEFRYLLDNGYSTAAQSAAITVSSGGGGGGGGGGGSGGSYSLTPSAATISPGASLSIAWTAPSGSSPYDWVALYRAGDPNTSYLWWSYTSGSTSGSAAITAPTTTGTYEFRYLLNGAYTDALRSSPVTVTSGGGGGGGGGGSTYSLAPSATTVNAGASFSIAWTAPTGSSTHDWVAFYRVGDPNTSYLWWTYTGGSASGSASITAPTTAGTYEFRYLLNNGYTDAARSTSVAVTSSSGGTYQIVNQFPHDSGAFTQGLVLSNGVLYESTGLFGSSSLRRVDRTTGAVLQRVDVAPQYFAEGITIFQGKIFQITWQSQIGFIYDPVTFAQIGQFSYSGEGWGLTHDGTNLIMSDGTSQIRFLNPSTFQTVRSITVRDEQGSPVTQINELEYINGEIYANLWQTDWIVRINPATGAITGRLDLSGLSPRGPNADVLNGIAYDQSTGHLLVTGKLWSWLYEIRLQ
jgi:glutaminyl-peptide cyclotransferase